MYVYVSLPGWSAGLLHIICVGSSHTSQGWHNLVVTPVTLTGFRIAGRQTSGRVEMRLEDSV